jgi:hypothetical protein
MNSYSKTTRRHIEEVGKKLLKAAVESSPLALLCADRQASCSILPAYLGIFRPSTQFPPISLSQNTAINAERNSIQRGGFGNA